MANRSKRDSDLIIKSSMKIKPNVFALDSAKKYHSHKNDSKFSAPYEAYLNDTWIGAYSIKV